MVSLQHIISNFLISFIIALCGTFSMLEQRYQSNLESTQTYSVDYSTEVQTSYASKFQILSQKLADAYNLSQPRAHRFSGWILNAIRNTPFSAETMAALIRAESSFRYQAESNVGAVGPAQVMPFFWSDKCAGDIRNDPRMNIACGARVLEDYYKQCNQNLKCALETYNVGPTNWTDPTYSGAKTRYLNKINKHKQTLAALNGY